MTLRVQEAAPTGPKISLHFFQKIFLINYWCWPWRGDPFEKKDGAKVLIFTILGFWAKMTPNRPPNDA